MKERCRKNRHKFSFFELSAFLRNPDESIKVDHFVDHFPSKRTDLVHLKEFTVAILSERLCELIRKIDILKVSDQEVYEVPKK